MHSLLVMELLCAELKNHEIKIIFSNAVGNENFLPKAVAEMKKIEKRRVKDFEDLLAEKLPGKNFEIFEEGTKINDPKTIRKIKELSVDLIISVRFGQIFREEIIKIPRFGIINLHSGKLPNYRGILASFWSVLKGEKELMATLHYVDDASIDTGKIISFASHKIDFSQSLLANIHQLYVPGSLLISSFFRKISVDQEVKTSPQNSSGGEYFSYPNEDEVRSLLRIIKIT